VEKEQVTALLFSLILQEPFKNKMHYIMKLSRNQRLDDMIREILIEAEREGLVLVEKDGQKKRYRLSDRGLKYLASIRG
jgi:DNA-binding transcriptional ArsR family regulator